MKEDLLRELIETLAVRIDGLLRDKNEPDKVFLHASRARFILNQLDQEFMKKGFVENSYPANPSPNDGKSYHTAKGGRLVP